MFAASFTAVIKTILIILLVYFGLKIILRWVAPLILKYFMKKAGKRFQDQFQRQQGFNSQQSQRKEGDVSIDKKPHNQRKSNKNVGEYIDYEEID